MSDAAQVPQIVKALRDTFNTHQTQSLEWRTEQLQLLHTILSTPAHRDELCHAMYLDLGRSRVESLTCEVEIALSEVIHFIHEIRTNPTFDMARQSTNILNLPASSYIRNDPYGVVLISSPWNYPVLLCLQPLAGALACGNTVLLRPGTYSKNTSICLQKLITKYFDPKNVNIVIGERDITTAVLKERFDMIFFTGGPTLGKLYHKAANEHLVPTVLELGGSNPVLVWNDINLTVAARRIAWGAYLNAGQTCIRPQNLFVHKDVAQEFIALVKQSVNEFYTFGNDPTEYRTQAVYENENDKGTKNSIADYIKQSDIFALQLSAENKDKSISDPTYKSNVDFIKQSPYFGRMITDDAFKRVAAILEQDKQFIVFGGETDPKERFIAPTIMVFNDIRDFQNSAAVGNGEIFGPIIPILIVDNIDTVTNWINSHDKALALYAFTNNNDIRDVILKNTSSGSLMFNDVIMQVTNPNIPFGGVGTSGMGGYHGRHSLNTFSHQKATMYKSDFGPADLAVRYPPYTTTSQSILASAITVERSNVLGYLTIPLVAVTGYGLYRIAPSVLPYAVVGLAAAKDWCEYGIAVMQNYYTNKRRAQAEEPARL